MKNQQIQYSLKLLVLVAILFINQSAFAEADYSDLGMFLIYGASTIFAVHVLIVISIFYLLPKSNIGLLENILIFFAVSIVVPILYWLYLLLKSIINQ